MSVGRGVGVPEWVAPLVGPTAVGQLPVGQAPVGQAPVGQAPVGQAPVGQVGQPATPQGLHGEQEKLVVVEQLIDVLHCCTARYVVYGTVRH